MFDELREMNTEIRKKQDKLDELRALAMSMTRPYSNDRVQTSSTDKLANIMCRILVLESEIDSMIDSYANEKQRIKAQIYKVEREEYQDILYDHYIEFKSLSTIAKQRKMSIDKVKKLNGKAKKAFKALDGTSKV